MRDSDRKEHSPVIESQLPFTVKYSKHHERYAGQCIPIGLLKARTDVFKSKQSSKIAAQLQAGRFHHLSRA